MDNLWIVVANTTAARLLAQRDDEDLREIKDLLCPESRQAERDVNTDAPGRSHDRMGDARHSIEPHTNVSEQIHEKFARRIASVLDDARKHNSYRYLVLVAEPGFLGELRKALDEHCRNMVIAECHKDIVTQSIDEIISLLPDSVQHKLKVLAH